MADIRYINNGLAAVRYPSYTYDYKTATDTIEGHTDGADALAQSLYCRLMTDRGTYPIYSQSYGLRRSEYIGMPVPLVYSAIQGDIIATVMQDDRVVSCDRFTIDTVTGDKDSVLVSFRVISIFGEITIEEVEV